MDWFVAMIETSQTIRMPREKFYALLVEYSSGRYPSDFSIGFAGVVHPDYKISIAEVFHHAGIIDRSDDVICSGEEQGFVFITLEYEELV